MRFAAFSRGAQVTACRGNSAKAINTASAAGINARAKPFSRISSLPWVYAAAVPTMAGATLLEVVKLVTGEEGNVLTQGNHLALLLLGCVVSFIVATLAIKGFIAFLTKYGFAAFGWYRIIVGVLILVMGLPGYELTMD